MNSETGTLDSPPLSRLSFRKQFPFGAAKSYNGNSISYITVLPGNGDGTFATPVTGQVYSQPATGGDVILGTLAAADFNGDGKLDLAVVGDYVSSGGVTILLGNGDGTFTAAGPNLDLTADFALIATGDFNGDGIPDFVTPNYFEFGGTQPFSSVEAMGRLHSSPHRSPWTTSPLPY